MYMCIKLYIYIFVVVRGIEGAITPFGELNLGYIGERFLLTTRRDEDYIT